MVGYYRDALGLEVLDTEQARLDDDRVRRLGRAEPVVLGRDGAPMLVLLHTPDLPRTGPAEAGLYHTAIVYDSAATLAQAVRRTMDHPGSRYMVAMEHDITDAFYFLDPEGNGIELYRDRPRETWKWTGKWVHITAVEVDGEKFLNEHYAGPVEGAAA